VVLRLKGAFMHFGVRNIFNLKATIVDPLLEIVRTGIGGAVIAAVLGKLKIKEQT
jgi:hypothetical protein